MGTKKKRNLFRKVPLCFFRREAVQILEVCTPLQEGYRMVTYEKHSKELLLKRLFVRYRQFASSFGSSGSQNPSAIGSRHSFSKAVLVFSLSAGRLKCSFHDRISLSSCSFDCFLCGLPLKRIAKISTIFLNTNRGPTFVSLIVKRKMIQTQISCSNPASQFLDLQLRISCVAGEIIRLQLPAWRAGRYQLANYAQNIRGVRATSSQGISIPFAKTSKDRWELVTPEQMTLHIHYQYWAGKMDAGSAWVDDEQVYVNLVNCCFEVLGRSEEGIAVTVDLPQYPEQILTLDPTGPNSWVAANYQQLADATLLAAKSLHHWTYAVGETQFHVWIKGEVYFDKDLFLHRFEAFSSRLVTDFGAFPEDSYAFIFQLLPYAHYHGVEHRRGTVITFGPANTLTEELAMEELLGIACHELYHAWNVCRIRPKEFLSYDFSKETYTQEGLVLEGVTTYFGDLYLLKSGVYNLPTYLRHLEKILAREAAQFGWKNASIQESSHDLWLDGYVAGIPDRKVNIYTRGALLSLCLDVLLLQEGYSLAQVMKMMWENFGLPFKGYDAQDFETLVSSQISDPEKITHFFNAYVRGKEDLFPVLEECLKALGITIKKTLSENTLLHQAGIQLNGQQVVQQIHPESIAHRHLMAQDQLVATAQPSDNSTWEVTVLRQGRALQLSFEKEAGNYYPILQLIEGVPTPMRSNWMD
jgi:predicted metalloprotease with PDZ domain